MTLWQDLQRLQNTLSFYNELLDHSKTLSSNPVNKQWKPKLLAIQKALKQCIEDTSSLFDLMEQYPSELWKKCLLNKSWLSKKRKTWKKHLTRNTKFWKRKWKKSENRYLTGLFLLADSSVHCWYKFFSAVFRNWSSRVKSIPSHWVRSLGSRPIRYDGWTKWRDKTRRRVKTDTHNSWPSHYRKANTRYACMGSKTLSRQSTTTNWIDTSIFSTTSISIFPR